MVRRHPRTRLALLGVAMATLVIPMTRLVAQHTPAPATTGYVAPHDPPLPLPLPAPPSPTPGGYTSR